jgi:aminoglycoside phosphotransferase (APT) family kinase protein
MPGPDVEGIDGPNVERWLLDHVPGLAAPFRAELIAGGNSNLTYRITDADNRDIVLRRPPLGQVLATAHDVVREHRIISALGPTDVPVAPALGCCDDPAVNGAPFYVMDFVPGTIVRDERAAQALTPAQRRTASESLVDVLVKIHAVQPDAVGLGDLGRRDGYIERQLKRWYGQYLKSQEHTPDLDFGAVGSVHDRLVANVPAQQSSSIVHGDYRLDNCMLAADGSVEAVLDWEICTLGDPLADLGLLWVYWTDSEAPATIPQASPTALDGFLSRKEVLERYSAASNLDLSNIGYYIAYGYWKLTCILAGVYSRYAAGAMGDVPAEQIEGFRQLVQGLADLTEAAGASIGTGS